MTPQQAFALVAEHQLKLSDRQVVDLVYAALQHAPHARNLVQLGIADKVLDAIQPADIKAVLYAFRRISNPTIAYEIMQMAFPKVAEIPEKHVPSIWSCIQMHAEKIDMPSREYAKDVMFAHGASIVTALEQKRAQFYNLAPKFFSPGELNQLAYELPFAATTNTYLPHIRRMKKSDRLEYFKQNTPCHNVIPYQLFDKRS